MLRNVELRIPPTYLNVLNFLVFDIILILLVYLLSSDVMQRLNDMALRDGKLHRLFITYPPVLGGGLCSTNRLRAQLLLLARLLGLGLILASGLAVKGEARAEPFLASRNVLTHGNASFIKDEEVGNG